MAANLELAHYSTCIGIAKSDTVLLPISLGSRRVIMIVSDISLCVFEGTNFYSEVYKGCLASNSKVVYNYEQPSDNSNQATLLLPLILFLESVFFCY